MTGQTDKKIKLLDKIIKFIGKQRESIEVRHELQRNYNYSYGTILNSIYPEIKRRGYKLKRIVLKIRLNNKICPQKRWCFIRVEK